MAQAFDHPFLAEATPLDFDKSLPEVPPSHSWSLSSIQNHPIISIDVPIVDLNHPNPKLMLDQIKYACEDWGFFTIINHGVSEQLLEDFKTETIRLFSLTREVKLRVLSDPKVSDQSGYGVPLASRFSPIKTWNEGFSIKNSLHEHSRKLWPPHGNPKFCQVMEEYRKTMKTLAEKVLTLMLGSVGLSPDDTNWAEPKTKESPFGPHFAHFQLNSYPPCPDPDHAMGLTQHTDSSIITVLNQVNNTGGLQILHKDKWVDVKPKPGAFVVNLGDLAHFISNGQFLSPVHRVLPSLAGQRYSSAYFYGPPLQAPLTVLPKLVGPGSRFRTFTWKDFCHAKYEDLVDMHEFMRVEEAETGAAP